MAWSGCCSKPVPATCLRINSTPSLLIYQRMAPTFLGGALCFWSAPIPLRLTHTPASHCAPTKFSSATEWPFSRGRAWLTCLMETMDWSACRSSLPVWTALRSGRSSCDKAASSFAAAVEMEPREPVLAIGGKTDHAILEDFSMYPQHSRRLRPCTRSLGRDARPDQTHRTRRERGARRQGERAAQHSHRDRGLEDRRAQSQGPAGGLRSARPDRVARLDRRARPHYLEFRQGWEE